MCVCVFVCQCLCLCVWGVVRAPPFVCLCPFVRCVCVYLYVCVLVRARGVVRAPPLCFVVCVCVLFWCASCLSVGINRAPGVMPAPRQSALKSEKLLSPWDSLWYFLFVVIALGLESLDPLKVHAYPSQPATVSKMLASRVWVSRVLVSRVWVRRVLVLEFWCPQFWCPEFRCSEFWCPEFWRPEFL